MVMVMLMMLMMTMMLMMVMMLMMLMMQGRVVPTEDSLTAEWWETRARLSAGGLLGAGCQVGEDEDGDDQEDG